MAWAPWPARAGPLWTRFPFPVASHGWKVQQHREPGGSFNKRPDRGAVQSQDQVAFPMSWHCPVVGLGWAFADEDLGADEAAAPLPGSCPRDPQRSPGSQTRHQLPFERTSALHIKRLVDWPRERSAWTHCGGNRSGAGSIFARGSNPSPTGDQPAVRDGDRST